MLKDVEMVKAGEGVSKAYDDAINDIKKDIARRFKEAGEMTSTGMLQAEVLEKMGASKTSLIHLIAKSLNIPLLKSREIFIQTIKIGLERDNIIYKKNGKTEKQLKLSPEVKKVFEQLIKREEQKARNLSLTMADTEQEYLIEEVNKMILEVSTGGKTLDQSVRDATKRLENHIPDVIYPSGRKINVKSAIKMMIATSVNQVHGQLQLKRAEELGTDLMEISAHYGARPDHCEWQGHIVSLTGKKKGYLTLKDIGYGEADGFMGVNCRHSWSPYFEGTKRTFTAERLKELKLTDEQYKMLVNKKKDKQQYKLYKAKFKKKKEKMPETFEEFQKIKYSKENKAKWEELKKKYRGNAEKEKKKKNKDFKNILGYLNK